MWCTRTPLGLADGSDVGGALMPEPQGWVVVPCPEPVSSGEEQLGGGNAESCPGQQG